VIKWIAIAVAGWIALSIVLFTISAQLQEGVSSEAEEALSGGGSFFTGATTLVLGSDSRKGDSLDPSQAVGRADTIMLIHSSFGSTRKLSIPRDAAADIPGHGTQKINAAYAIGGPSLTIETVEAFLGNGLKIHHIVEVDFEHFPEFIDALGGITVNNKTKICAPEFDNFYRGFNLPKGEQELDGRQALGFARVRNNRCAPNENDLDRAQRQQEVLGGIKGKAFSAGTFVRLPWVSWKAPKALRTDLKAPGLAGLGLDVGTGGVGETDVLKPSCLSCGPASSLLVSDAEKTASVDRLLGN
jgi:LCP family protein required for cell wall assembly